VPSTTVGAYNQRYLRKMPMGALNDTLCNRLFTCAFLRAQVSLGETVVSQRAISLRGELTSNGLLP
jgi:hypothetical protein